MRLPEGKAWWWLTVSSGRSLMGFSSVSWPPCASTLRAGPLQTPQRGTDPAQRWLRDTQEHNGLLMAGRTLCCLGLLDPFLSGARGEAWLHASGDSCWHTPDPMKRLIAASGRTRATDQTLTPPLQASVPSAVSSSLSQTSLVSFSLFYSSFLHKIKKYSSTHTFDLGFVTEFLNIFVQKVETVTFLYFVFSKSN